VVRVAAAFIEHFKLHGLQYLMQPAVHTFRARFGGNRTRGRIRKTAHIGINPLRLMRLQRK
jgi:hypothetical protein